MTLKLTTIQKRHKRKDFDCGYPELNDFLAKHARGSDEKRVTRTYILEDPSDPDVVLGFATLTFTNIDIPEQCQAGRHLKSPVPALLLAKMGVSTHHQGNGYGKKLLIFAIRQAARIAEEAGGVGLVIDAKDEKAKSFYMSRAGEDIEIIDDSGLKLWIPLDICNAIARASQGTFVREQSFSVLST